MEKRRAKKKGLGERKERGEEEGINIITKANKMVKALK